MSEHGVSSCRESATTDASTTRFYGGATAGAAAATQRSTPDTRPVRYGDICTYAARWQGAAALYYVYGQCCLVFFLDFVL